MEPWQQYLDVFQQSAARIPPHAFGRSDLLAEAAHDAYQKASDRLTAAGRDSEDTLVIMRLLNQVTKDWIGRDGENLEMLREDMQRHYEGWTRPLEG